MTERAHVVAVLAPSGKDGRLAEQVLGNWGLEAAAHADMASLCAAVRVGVGAVLLAEEALRPRERELLLAELEAQPAWSDVPIVVLTAEGELSRVIADGVEAIARRGNVTLLERPVRVATLVTVLRSALRARQRQYDVRDHLAERAATEAALRESEARLRTLADAMPQLAWMAQPDGYIFWYNRRWYEYTGTSPEAMTGWGWRAVHDPELLPEVIERWTESIRTGQPFEMEFPLKRADGAFRWFLTRVHPMKDAQGRVMRWFGTNTDIQAQREAREAMEAARAEAEDARHAAEEARGAAEAANRAKSEFLAVMSHELRTPLNAIAGYAELIELGIHGPVTEGQREALRRVQRSERHLLGLINGVLNYARIETGNVHYAVEDVPADEVLATAEALVSPQMRTRGLRLEFPGCPPGVLVRGDREKMQQIVLNLLSNAIKFTEPGGRVSMTCEARDGAVLIRVADTGVGIAPEKQQAIFEPFVQVDARLTRTQEGIGLGLAISRDLARGMGGDLSVDSEMGRGSTFTLSLPRA